MKKQILLGLLALLIITNAMAQKIIPFQYQSQKQWNNNAPWGYMNEDRKIIFTPFLNSLTPKVYNGKYRNCNEGIKDITTGKIIIDSVQAIGTYDIKGNLLSVKNPKYSGYYTRFSVTNIITKKTNATSALSFTNIPNYTLVRNFDETDIKHREGVIDENGKEIIPLKYDKIKGNGFGFFAVFDNDDIYVYNIKGKMLNKNPYSYIDILSYEDASKRITKAQRKLEGTPTVYENLLLDPNGNEIGIPFYTLDSKHPFVLYAVDDYIFYNKDVPMYKNKDCSEANKMIKNIVIDNTGKIIFNTDEYKSIAYLNENLWHIKVFTGYDYLLNKNGNKVNNLNLSSKDMLYIANDINFINVENNMEITLNFYGYNKNENKVKLNERITFDLNIKEDKLFVAYGKYYILVTKNTKTQQYETYIYDVNGKLILKDDAAIYKLDDDKKMLIKYLAGANYTELYLTYLDENLKPYSFITE